MKHVLILTKAFKRNFRKFSAVHPDLVASARAALERLERNPFDPPLATHRLTGNLSGLLA